MKIICYGDSNTWGYDPRIPFGGRYERPWPELLAEKLECTVINQGENGREIPKGSVYFPPDTDCLMIMLGTNDLLQSHSPESTCRRMELFLKMISLESENILLIAPPPMILGEWVQSQTLIEDVNSLARYYQNLAKRLGIQFVDSGKWKVSLTFDGVHLTEQGHSLFAEELYKFFCKESGNELKLR